MIVEVTQEDINKGTRRIANFCPIALALKRQSGWIHVSVSTLRVQAWGTWTQPIYKTRPSTTMINFIRKFDRGGRGLVKPHRFRIDIPKAP